MSLENSGIHSSIDFKKQYWVFAIKNKVVDKNRQQYASSTASTTTSTTTSMSNIKPHTGGLYDVYMTTNDKTVADDIVEGLMNDCEIIYYDPARPELGYYKYNIYVNAYVIDSFSYEFEISWLRKKGRYWCFLTNRDIKPSSASSPPSVHSIGTGGFGDIDEKHDSLEDVLRWTRAINTMMAYNNNKHYDYHIYDSYMRRLVGEIV
jgi:hypothetical protein